MKKYFAIFAALSAVILSSCSNDDIPVSHSITFKLNPSTVVDKLYEWSAGDLTSLTSDRILNVELYIYDQSGELVCHDSQDFNSYTHIMTSHLELGNGTYTAVAVSHVSGDVDFWDFDGMSNLNTLKITDNGYIGGESKILGLTAKKIQVSDGNKTFNIDIENAGAVICIHITNWNRYSDAAYFGLISKQSCDYLTMDSNGEAEYSLESKSSYAYYMLRFAYNSEYVGIYSYSFSFPIRNAAMKFFIESTDNTRYYLGNEFVKTLSYGGSYLVEYDVTNETTSWTDVTTRCGSGYESYSPVQEASECQPAVVYDYEAQSISIR